MQPKLGGEAQVAAEDASQLVGDTGDTELVTL